MPVISEMGCFFWCMFSHRSAIVWFGMYFALFSVKTSAYSDVTTRLMAKWLLIAHHIAIATAKAFGKCPFHTKLSKTTCNTNLHVEDWTALEGVKL